MISAMPTTKPFSNILTPRTHQPFVKMKTDPFCNPLRKDSDFELNADEVEELFEGIDLNEDETSNANSWPNKRASKHLSGGGLLADFSNIFQPQEVISSNPFKTATALEETIVPTSTNPFSIFVSESSLKSPSQCSTRPTTPEVPPPTISNNPFLKFPITSNQSTQTSNESSSLAPWLLSHQSDEDLICLQRTLTHLRVCGWYYENVSWQDSVILLRNSEPGTFLIRDSLDPNFLFSLSVQTTRGPTSVRLHYVNGKFRLDAEEKLIASMPSFPTVIDLIDYYIDYTREKNRKCKSKEQVWVDSLGQVYSHILLSKPLYKKNYFPSLKHLSRLEFNKWLRKYYTEHFQNKINQVNPYVPMIEIIKSLWLPQSLLEYLLLYPFSH